MIKDPATIWPGPYPYDVLAPIGITPQSSQADVAKASFALMTQRLMNPTTQKAWEELRNVGRRLLADCLLYDVDLDEEIARADAWAREELARPGEPPELTAALDAPIELLDELAALLREPLPTPAPLAVLPDDPGAAPDPALLRSLTEFDR